ncbi:hypothetical protein Tco_1505559 [Tanacetum coccineum]
MRVQTQVESNVAMTKRRHGNRAAMQFVFIPKAKPNTISEVSYIGTDQSTEKWPEQEITSTGGEDDWWWW